MLCTLPAITTSRQNALAFQTSSQWLDKQLPETNVAFQCGSSSGIKCVDVSMHPTTVVPKCIITFIMLKLLFSVHAWFLIYVKVLLCYLASSTPTLVMPQHTHTFSHTTARTNISTLVYPHVWTHLKANTTSCEQTRMCSLTHMDTHAMGVITVQFSPSPTPYTIECAHATHTHLLRHKQSDSDYEKPKAAWLLELLFFWVHDYDDINTPSATVSSINRRTAQSVVQTKCNKIFVCVSTSEDAQNTITMRNVHKDNIKNHLGTL